jgi:hypothetical protein
MASPTQQRTLELLLVALLIVLVVWAVAMAR